MNSIRIRARIIGSGVATTVNLTADTAFGASGESGANVGSGNIDLTAALATLLARKFDTILYSEQVATPIDALLDQVQSPSRPRASARRSTSAPRSPRQRRHAGKATSMNRAQADLINCESARWSTTSCAPSSPVATSCTTPAIRPTTSMGTAPGPAQILAGLDRPINDSALPTTTELKSMLNQGVTPSRSPMAAHPTSSDAVTSQCKDPAATLTTGCATLTSSRSATASNDLVAELAAAPWTKITRDPVGNRPEPGAEFATPTPRQGADRATAERLRKQRLD